MDGGAAWALYSAILLWTEYTPPGERDGCFTGGGSGIRRMGFGRLEWKTDTVR